MSQGGFCYNNTLNGQALSATFIEKGEGYYELDGKYYVNFADIGNEAKAYDRKERAVAISNGYPLPEDRRLYYTIEEAMQHVNHTNHNTIRFIFK